MLFSSAGNFQKKQKQANPEAVMIFLPYCARIYKHTMSITQIHPMPEGRKIEPRKLISISGDRQMNGLS